MPPRAWGPRRPARPARTSPALPYSASASTAPKRAPEASTRSISSSAIRHFGRYATASGTPAAARRAASAARSSGRNSRRPTPTGTSAPARVSETSDWQVRPLPELAAVLPLHADRVAPLPHERGVVHDQHRVRPAHQPVGGPHQLVLERRGGPGRGGDEVVQLLEVARRDTRGHRLHALALAGHDQALEVEGRPAPLLLAPQPPEERLEPPSEFGLPAVSRRPLHRPLRREQPRDRNA